MGDSYGRKANQKGYHTDYSTAETTKKSQGEQSVVITKTPEMDKLAELNRYREETNGIFYSLSKTLITLAVLAMTISPAFTQKITDGTAKTLYVSAMGVALISVFAGVALHFSDWYGFRKYVHYTAAITFREEPQWTPKQKRLVKKFADHYQKDETFETGHVWLAVQIHAVLISLSLIFVVLTLNYLPAN